MRPWWPHRSIRRVAAILAPAVALTVATVLLGAVPALVDPLIERAASSLDPAVEGVHLKLWHGITVALGLSTLAVAVGAALFFGRDRVAQLQAALPRTTSGTEVYQSTVAATLHLADRVTGVVQSGSLPRYLQVALVTLLVLPGTALLAGPGLPEGIATAESPLQVVVAVLVVGAALAAARARRRFAAVLCLGGVGYGVAVLFVIQGAPDLALTQLLVETLAVVIFVLVLRHLPERFSETPRRLSRLSRAALSAGVGTFVAAFALMAGAARQEPAISGEFLLEGASRRWWPQRRQRDPRRLPGARHHGRDHRPRRRRARHRQPRAVGTVHPPGGGGGARSRPARPRPARPRRARLRRACIRRACIRRRRCRGAAGHHRPDVGW